MQKNTPEELRQIAQIGFEIVEERRTGKSNIIYIDPKVHSESTQVSGKISGLLEESQEDTI